MICVEREEKMNIKYDDQVLAEVADLKNEAVSKTGFNDFDDPFYEEPLAAWLHDLITGNLNDFGRQFLRRLVLPRFVSAIKSDSLSGRASGDI